MSATRRSILRGLAAAPLATLPVAICPQAADPIVPLFAEKRRLAGLINGGGRTEAEADALMDRWSACDIAALGTRATTPAGAMASIEWVRGELLEFGFRARPFLDEREAGIAADCGARLVLALLDGALGVLRAQRGQS